MNDRNKLKKLFPYFMILPAVAVCIVFLIYPIIYMIYLSFFKWNMIGEMKFIGWDNYTTMFSDPEFIKVILNTCKFTFWTVAGFIITGLGLAVFLQKNTWVNRLVQAVMFTPYVLPMVSIAYVWMWIMDADLGLLNYVLGLFGIDKINWLGDPDFAMYSLIIVNIWKAAGYYALLFLSALQSIPSYLYEAAELDHSKPITTFVKITLPMLSPTMFFLTLTAIIASFKVFETVNIMTDGLNGTTTLVYYIYQHGFKYYKIGYASAVGVVLMVIVSILTVIYFACLQKKVHYQ